MKGGNSHDVEGLLMSLLKNNRLVKSLSRLLGGEVPSVKNKKALTVDNINPGMKQVVYGVAGIVAKRASQLAIELQQGANKPFDEVIFAGLGDGLAQSQLPITFLHQVLSMVMYPGLLKCDIFPDDAKDRAEFILKHCKGNTIGAGTEFAGQAEIRKHVAEYLQKRDSGVPANPNDIILSNGTAPMIRIVISTLACKSSGKKPGVLLPVPHYPLFSACLQEYEIHQIDYTLEEDNDWALNVENLYRSVNEAKKVCQPRAIVVINPGNPTGQIFTEEEMKSIIKLAYEENLLILADEVYQESIFFPERPFHSFKKVLHNMGHPYNEVELCSFISASKGLFFECGLRGGLMEIVNLDPYVRESLNVVLSAQLCANTVGQVAIDIIVKPPSETGLSFKQYQDEKRAILQNLAKKAKIMTEKFNSIKGIHCNLIQGSYYAFPRIEMPAGAIREANRKGLDVDTYYALELLENKGISVTPGSSFGQESGSHHIRISFLPPEEVVLKVMELIKDFHEDFLLRHEA